MINPRYTVNHRIHKIFVPRSYSLWSAKGMIERLDLRIRKFYATPDYWEFEIHRKSSYNNDTYLFYLSNGVEVEMFRPKATAEALRPKTV